MSQAGRTALQDCSLPFVGFGPYPQFAEPEGKLFTGQPAPAE